MQASYPSTSLPLGSSLPNLTQEMGIDSKIGFRACILEAYSPVAVHACKILGHPALHRSGSIQATSNLHMHLELADVIILVLVKVDRLDFNFLMDGIVVFLHDEVVIKRSHELLFRFLPGQMSLTGHCGNRE